MDSIRSAPCRGATGRLVLAAHLPALLLVACATEPSSQTPVAAAAGGEQLCSREAQTGSHMMVTRCRTREQMRAETDTANEVVRRSRSGGANSAVEGN